MRMMMWLRVLCVTAVVVCCVASESPQWVILSDVDGDAQEDVIAVVESETDVRSLVWYRQDEGVLGEGRVIDGSMERAPRVAGVFAADFMSRGAPHREGLGPTVARTGPKDVAVVLLDPGRGVRVVLYVNNGGSGNTNKEDDGRNGPMSGKESGKNDGQIGGNGFVRVGTVVDAHSLDTPGLASMAPMDVDGDGRLDWVIADADLVWFRNERKADDGGAMLPKPFVHQGRLAGPLKDAAVRVLLKARGEGQDGKALPPVAALSSKKDKKVAAGYQVRAHNSQSQALKRHYSQQVSSRGTRLKITATVVVACIGFALFVNILHALR